MEEKRDEIEESLEDLLIFPTRKGLRRSLDMITSYFDMEVQSMEDIAVPESKRQSILNDQNNIVNMAKKELNSDKLPGGSGACCETG